MNSANEKDERRRKRRRRRIQVIVIYTAIAIGLAWFFESQATTTIIFIRHAEKMAVDDRDPDLSAEGRERVAELTRQMAYADVIQGVDAIYSTPFKRTQQTVQPLADELDLPINIYDASDTEEVLETILKRHKGKVILVVGHSNTIPQLIWNLGASKRVPPIDENEYDNVYIIAIPWFGKTKTIRLRYGTPYVPTVAEG